MFGVILHGSLLGWWLAVKNSLVVLERGLSSIDGLAWSCLWSDVSELGTSGHLAHRVVVCTACTALVVIAVVVHVEVVLVCWLGWLVGWLTF
jgi:hypothetical protein